MELVSCVIPTYKRSDMLSRAINSVLNQTYELVEALVVDDNEPGSPESQVVLEIISQYKDERVRYVGQKKHINGAVARNEGIAQSAGAYVAFLDDDDEWNPEKVEKQVQYLESHPEIDGVTCLYRIFSNGLEIRKCPPYTNKDLQFKVLSHQISMYTSTFLCRKEVLIQSGGFNPQLQRNQDLQMFADFLNHGEIEPLKEYMVILHEDSDINRKGIQKTIDAKEKFFEVEKKTIDKYDRKHRKRIYSAHYFDIIINAIRAKAYGKALEYIIKIGFSVTAYRDAFIRYKIKKLV